MQQKYVPRMRWRVFVVNVGKLLTRLRAFVLISRFRHFYLGPARAAKQKLEYI